MSGWFRRVVKRVLVSGLACLPSIAGAQVVDDWSYRTIWSSPAPSWSAPSYGDSPEQACRGAFNIGSQCLYYKGVYFKYTAPPSNPTASIGTDAQCVSDINISCPGIGVPPPRFWQVRLTCIKENTLTGQRVHVSYGACPPPIKRCEADCGETLQTGNPVEVPSLAKVLRDVDWQSPAEPRFRIDRLYRSDTLLVRTFETIVDSTRDPLAGVWQFGIQEWLIGAQKNPNSPSDTQTYWLYKSSAGMSAMFLTTNVSQTIGYAGGLRITQNTSALADLTASDGVVSQFRKVTGVGNPLVSRTWPDGYKITLTRIGSPAVQLSRMADNRGNIADFVYDSNVVPGAARPLVKEVILSRNETGTPTAFGKLVYSYRVLDYKWGPGGANTTPLTRRPVVSGVDYVDLATSQQIPLHRYSYASGVVDDELAYPPLLTAVSDGRLDALSNPIPFAEYSYSYGDSVALSGAAGYRVASTRFTGDTEARHYAQVGSSTVTETNTFGLTRTYTFTPEVLGNDIPLKLTAVDTPAVGEVLATNTTYAYAPSGPIASVTLPNGSVTTYARNARGLVTEMEEASGTAEERLTSYTWHPTLGLPLTRTRSRMSESYTYDANGLLTSYTQKDEVPASPSYLQTRTWTFGYTTLAGGLKVMTTLDGPGLTSEGVTDVTTFAYTALGDLISTTDPNGLVTTVLSRNGMGLPTLVEEPDGNRWALAYDRDGRIVSSALFAPGQTPRPSTYTYTLAGEVSTVTNSRGKTWTFTYSDARRLSEVVGPDGDKVTYAYDADGNVILEQYSLGSDPASFWEETSFDALGRLAQQLGAMGQIDQYRYDRMDNPVLDIDPLNYTTNRSFDALDRLISLVDRGLGTSSFAYDASDDLSSATDPRSLTTTFTRNGFGEIVQETSPDRGTILSVRDRRGLVTTRTDARGIAVGYVYDAGGRPTWIDYPPASLPDVTITWDQAFLGVPVNANKGSIGRIDDGVLTQEFGHEVTATGPRLTTRASYPNARIYTLVEDTDFEGNATRTVYPSGREILYELDNAGRIAAIRLKDGATTTTLVETVTYAPNGPQVSAVYGDGFTQTRTYDASYRLTALVDSNLTTVLRDQSFGYEARDNLTATSDTLLPPASESFGYTPREELASAAGGYGALGFGYDAVGNRLTRSQGAATDLYSYPATSNRLTGIALAGGGTRAFSHDAAGNVISETVSGTTRSFDHDAAGRLAAVRTGATLTASYLYDAMGRQAVRRLTAGPLAIHSVFDSAGRRIAEYNETSGALIREYVWNGWEPVAILEGGAVYLVRTDPIGRPVFATTTSGALVWSVRYTPFGAVDVTTGTPTDARFPGQWFQIETGLHQNWMRDYDPTTGRYLQPDPLGLIDGPSLYGYARQNPGRYSDETGECPICPFLPAIAAGVAYLLTPEAANTPGFCEAIVPLDESSPLVNAIVAATTMGVGRFAVIGKEISFGKNIRVAPFGNRTGNQFGRWPHYHRRGGELIPGKTKPGQGIGRHRPWETKSNDSKFWDRF